MSSMSQNTKRLAKNTILLYFRMIVLMIISLYTSRVILDALGVTDYGIYNVVGGFVAMFSVLSGTLSAAITRFLTFEIGKGDKSQISKIFSTSINIQLIIAFLIVLVAETFETWFVFNKMVIPSARLHAAYWVFQLSLITFCVNLLSVPYNATLIAHERMNAFAYISVIEGVLKLCVAFAILTSSIDKLIYYGIAMTFVAIIIRFIYAIYCKRSFEECDYHFILDRQLLKQMFGFAGWNFFGASAGILRDQGGNLLLNVFFDPSVNAARGIAIQVNSAVYSFATNFTQALNPQITKAYANNQKSYMHSLMFQGSKFSYFILLLLGMPIIINTPYILNLWLTLIPEYSVVFVRYAIVLSMSEALSLPFVTGMLATGKIRNYQLIVGGINLLNLPLVYVLFVLGFNPQILFWVAIILSQCCLFARVFMLTPIVNITIKDFFFKVYVNVLLVTLVSFIPSFWGCTSQIDSFERFCISMLVCFFICISAIWVIGIKKEEKKFILSQIRVKLK